MRIRLQNLATMPEHRVRFDYSIDLSKEEVSFEYPFQSPVRLEGEVSDASGVITLQATVHSTVSTHCARCGEPVRYEKETPVSFLLVKELANEDDDFLEDLYVVESDEVELDEILIPELILDLEMSVLCREDCKGLCPKCGCNLNRESCGCNTREIDPRLAVLQTLLDKSSK